MSMILRLSSLVAVFLLCSPTWAADPIQPDWMTIDTGKKSVRMEIVAGFNVNNNNWNFNGYIQGTMTVVVPAGWKVEIEFISQDGNYPHSLVIIDAPANGETLPVQADRTNVAISRAYSRDPLGGIYNDKDTIRFTAKQAGDYLFFCGVPGHGLAGMWTYFTVSDSADQPYITITEAADGRL